MYAATPMSGSSLSVKSGKRTRTFTGCLTCRRRKVKCPGPTRPCQTCVRLKLECVSPFPSNLRSAAIKDRPRLQQQVSSKNGSQLSESQNPTNDSLIHSLSSSGTRSFPARADVSSNPGMAFYDLQTPIGWDPTSVQGDSYLQSDISTFNRPLFPYAPPSNETNSPCFPTPSSSEAPHPSWFSFSVEDSTTVGSETALNQAQLVDGSDQNVASGQIEVPNTEDNDLNKGPCPNSIGIGLGLFLPEAEASTMNYFKTCMASTLSVKNVQWNIFSYFLNLGDRVEQSSVKSSIAAWSAAHQVLEGRSTSNEYLAHYAFASARLDTLLIDQSDIGEPTESQLEILLVTTYSLCHCDVITCNASSLVTRLDRIKDIFQKQWDSLSLKLTGTGARLLLWLGYLDLRRCLFLDGDGSSAEPFLEWVSKHHGLPQLYSRSRLYLKEAFGECYPSLELREDMIQDPVNTKFTAAMFLLGQIIKQAQTNSSERSYEESDHLRQQIDELEKECDIALQGFTSEGSVMITRTSYHWLNLKAINNSSIILLSRIRAPTIRAEEEAQCAAVEISKITIKLRKAKKLHNPHSVFSILPIFLAGIETIDEVHQDWVARFLEYASDWGLHVQNAAKLLDQVVEKQKQTGCRLGLRDIADLAATQVVL